MTNFTIICPWPSATLSPNSRKHWAPVAQAKRTYRQQCWALALEAGVRASTASVVHVHMEYHPPDNRRRDDDNMIAAFKAGRDGIADAMGIDDHKWTTSHSVTRDKGGCVIVTIALDPQVAELPIRGAVG